MAGGLENARGPEDASLARRIGLRMRTRSENGTFLGKRAANGSLGVMSGA
jgi:hypothetical protein